MQKVLNKRIIRDLKANFLRYFALFLLIMMGMYLIISIVGAAENVIIRVGEASKINEVEDGEFTVFVPLEKKNIEELKEKGITLEKKFYMDYTQKDQSTLRIYKNREQVNLIDLDDGKLAKYNNEIVLEKHYAQKHNLIIGSTINIADKLYKITGIGSVPDYDAAFKNMSDSSIESNIFGLGFVTDGCYTALKEKGKSSKTEEYVYSYLLNSSMTQDELKNYLSNLKLDKSKVTDIYFLKMLQDLEKMKNDTQKAVGNLSDGTKKLNQGLMELTENNDEIISSVDQIFDHQLAEVSKELSPYGLQEELTKDNYEIILNHMVKENKADNPALNVVLESVKEELSGYKEFKQGMKDYTTGTKDSAEGSKKLLEGVQELQIKIDEMVNQYFDIDIDNLTQFVEKKDNPRIAASVDDVQINKMAGIVSGFIIMALFTYVISVFVIHGIEQESSVIGALYALGVTKKQLINHYLMLPVIITFVAGTIGTVIGFSPLGVGYQTVDSVNYFSLPQIQTVYPIYLVVYGIIMPPLVAAIVNYFVINKKLSQPALKLIRNEQKQNRISNLQLGGLKFIPKFQIRQFLREIRSSLTVVLGMFIALLIMMMGFDCYILCHNMSVQNKEDTTYKYMYTYKYPTKEVPVGGEACYAETLKKEVLGYDLDVSILGIDQNNKYFDFNVVSGKNKVAISKSVATKYKLSIGEKLVLCDEVNDMDYAFTIDKIVPYSVGLYLFMDINSMRDLFGQEDNYYNLVLSDKALNINPGRLYATTTKDDISKGADVFVNNMFSMIITLIVSSIIMFVIVMYLMMKVMIDRSAFHISLMKIFGYQEKEIKKLFLDGNFIMVAVSAAICIPLAKLCMDILYPYFVSNIACGMDLKFTLKMYVGIYLGVLSCYVIINQLLVGRLKKMVPAEVLKNRE